MIVPGGIRSGSAGTAQVGPGLTNRLTTLTAGMSVATVGAGFDTITLFARLEYSRQRIGRRQEILKRMPVEDIQKGL